MAVKSIPYICVTSVDILVTAFCGPSLVSMRLACLYRVLGRLSLIPQCPGRPGLLTRVGGMPRKRYTARPRSGRVTSTHTRTHVPIRPPRGLPVKALRGMPPTLFNRPVLFTKRSITRCLGHAGDRQIFNLAASRPRRLTLPRHAADPGK